MGHAQHCVVMDTTHVITVVIVAVVPSLCFRLVGSVSPGVGDEGAEGNRGEMEEHWQRTWSGYHIS